MNLYKLIILLAIFSGIGFNTYAQKDTVGLNTIITKTSKVSSELPFEKVYLHFDKPYYAVNDTLWFKGYLMVDRRMLSDYSKVLYIDVFTETDSLVQSLKLPVINGEAFGNVTLTAVNYKQGNYRFRAYTNWMRNFDPDYFFNKNVVVGSAVDKEVNTHIAFSQTGKDKQEKISANIGYKNEENVPLADRKVTWKVETGFETTAKGKASTDKSGNAIINFPASVLSDSLQSVLYTTVEFGDKKTITKSFPLSAAATAIDVQFFPEGGDLLAGIRSKVAFKAIKPNGLGTKIKGFISDNSGNKIIDFNSQHLGMGVFLLQPEPGKTYKASIQLPNGTERTFNLPQVKESGINLSAYQTDTSSLTIKITANDAFHKSNQNKKFYVIGHSGGIVCYAAQTTLQNATYSAQIQKEKFPTGIANFTLLDDHGKPLSERIIFIKNNDLLDLSLKTAKNNFGTFQKVKMDVSAKSANAPMESTLSVAVINETKVKVDENAETTILNSLLLTSDLKGYIEKPNYYFVKTSDKTREDLDVLMLTQGYRRFSYPDIVANKLPPIAFLPEQGIEISGTLRSMNGMPINKGNISLLIPDRNFGKETITNADGAFKFTDLMFADSSKLTLNARNNTNNKNLMIMLDAFRSQGYTANHQIADEILNIDSALSPYLENSKKQYSTSRMLKEVVIKADAVKKPSHLDYSGLSGLSVVPDHLIDGSRFTGCGVFANCLQTMMLGMTFVDNTFYVTRDYNAGNRTPAQIFLNGMPIDVTALISINSAEVESVEVFLKDVLGTVNRMYNSNGAIVINTKKIEGTKISKQELIDLFPPKYLLTFSPQGYTMARQFYSPKYEGPRNLSTTDLRTTILWNPKVTTDSTGATSFEFYTAGEKGTYRAVVEGIDKDGHIGRYVYRFSVE